MNSILTRYSCFVIADKLVLLTVFTLVRSILIRLVGLVSLFDGISTFVGYLMPTQSLWKNKRETIKPIAEAGGLRGIHTFLKGIRPKVKVMAQREFELTHFEASVQHIIHYTLIR